MSNQKDSISPNATPIIYERAKNLRKNMTKAEELLWGLLRNSKVSGKKFRRQHPIDNYILDFYCHELKLAIELDGEIHLLPHVKEHDIGRTYELENYSISILRFTNDEVLTNPYKVSDEIKGFIATMKQL
ncbi:MAG: endonuclease domain-containing protein [Flavobacteriaceae bacterium]|nr:endonuclease domain-containing protein [Flavobacteriaceae bacterium]